MHRPSYPRKITTKLVSSSGGSAVLWVVSGCVSCSALSCSMQVLLVTDGSLGIGKGSLRHSLQTLKQRADDKKFPLPFPFPTKMFIMCVANAEEVSCPSIHPSIPLRHTLLQYNISNIVFTSCI